MTTDDPVAQAGWEAEAAARLSALEQTEDRVTPYEEAVAALGTASRAPGKSGWAAVYLPAVQALAGIGWSVLALTEEMRYSMDRLITEVRDDERPL